jgi:ABC-type transport system involved in multi-copper enzyme maturation permease subunit
MKQIKSIAINTIKETVRDKIYYSVFLFVIFLVFLTYFLGQLTYRDEAKITMDLGLAAMNLSGILVSIFLGVSLVLKEIDTKTLYTILSRPIPRYKFILGKYFGLAVIIFGILLSMSVIVAVNVLLVKGTIPPLYYQAILLMFCEMLIMIAVAMFFSTFTTTVLSSVFSIGFYLIAHSSSAFSILIKRSDGFKNFFLRFANFISPNFSSLNLKNLLPYETSVSSGVVLWGVLYTIMYGTLFLTVSILVFSRKDLK